MPGHQHTEADPPGKTGYSIGLSIALSLMLFIGGMLKSRSLQAAQLNGALVRSAVSPPHLAMFVKLTEVLRRST